MCVYVCNERVCMFVHAYVYVFVCACVCLCVCISVSVLSLAFPIVINHESTLITEL